MVVSLHVSYILDILGKMLMSLELPFEVLVFFLKFGVTSATFKSDGTIEFSIQKFVFL